MAGPAVGHHRGWTEIDAGDDASLRGLRGRVSARFNMRGGSTPRALTRDEPPPLPRKLSSRTAGSIESVGFLVDQRSMCGKAAALATCFAGGPICSGAHDGGSLAGKLSSEDWSTSTGPTSASGAATGGAPRGIVSRFSTMSFPRCVSRSISRDTRCTSARRSRQSASRLHHAYTPRKRCAVATRPIASM